MDLDLKTLLVCLLIGNFITVLLVLLYRSSHTKTGTSKLFVTAKLLQLVTLLMLLLKDILDIRFALVMVTLLGVSAATAESVALLKLLGVYSIRIRRFYYTLSAVSATGLGGLYLLQTDASFYTASASMAGILFMLCPAYMLCVKIKGTPLQELMGLFYLVVMLSLMGRAVEVFFAPFPQGGTAAGLLQAFFYTGIYLLALLGTAGFMLLTRELSYAELERVATYDELTGILNRRAFLLRARPLIEAANKEGNPFSFLLVDIDHFKRVNDTFGHDTGDKVLQHFARQIERQLGNGDLFGRFGGEEFAVLLHRADEQESGEVAERMRLSVHHAVIHGVPLSYTVSIGIFTVDKNERFSLNALYKLSDTALYQAKQQGRNRVVRNSGILH